MQTIIYKIISWFKMLVWAIQQSKLAAAQQYIHDQRALKALEELLEQNRKELLDMKAKKV